MLTRTPRRPPARLPLALLCAVLLVAALLSLAWHPAYGFQESVLADAPLAEDGAGAGGSAVATERSLAGFAVPRGWAGERPPPIPKADVSVADAVHVYEVEGADVRTLLASLRQRGPSDGDGTWAASTTWVSRWSYRPVSDLACRVESARVELDLRQTYPRWVAPVDVAPAVVTAWQRFLAHVEEHEQGHREIAEAAADDLAREIVALSAQVSCAALGRTVRATTAEVLARHAQAQAAYDRDTGHGRTQGAVLSLDR